jgi:O-antigen ligase
VIPRYLATERLKIPIAIGAGLALAMGLAVAVGSGDFYTVRRVFFIGIMLVLMLFGQQYGWRAAFAVCLLDFYYLGFAFKISNIEQTGVLAVLIIVITWWRKERIEPPAVMETMTFRIFNLSLQAWLLYSFGHLIYNTLDPYAPTEFALKNFLKTIVQFSGPLLILFYFLHRPTGIVVNDRLPVHILGIGLVALGVNLFARFWELQLGMLDPTNQIEGETPYFSIPALDVMANFYALRTLGPVLGVVSIVFINGPWFQRQSFIVRTSAWLVYLLSIVAAAFSGGRATLLFVFVLSLVALWLRKHYQVVLGLIAAGILFVLALNLVPDVLRPLPLVMQRSLQSIVFTTESLEARDSIDSSTSWRWELVQRAFEQWHHDSRVYWFGRGTYSFGPEDYRAIQRNAGMGYMEVSLRRGATHSLVTDLLLTFGLVGFVIYMTLFVTLVILLWRIWKMYVADPIAEPLALTCLVLTVFYLLYGILGGGGIPLVLALFVVVLFGYLYRLKATTKEKPSEGLRGLGRRLAPSLVGNGSARWPAQPFARVKRASSMSDGRKRLSPHRDNDPSTRFRH